MLNEPAYAVHGSCRWHAARKEAQGITGNSSSDGPVADCLAPVAAEFKQLWSWPGWGSGYSWFQQPGWEGGGMDQRQGVFEMKPGMTLIKLEPMNNLLYPPVSVSLSNGATARGGPRPPSRVSSILPSLGRLFSNFYTLTLLRLPPLHLPNATWVSLWGAFLLAHWGGLSWINHCRPGIWHVLPISVYSACRISHVISTTQLVEFLVSSNLPSYPVHHWAIKSRRILHSKILRWCSSCLDSTHVSAPYISTGLINVL